VAREARDDIFCPVNATMDLLGQKWTLRLLRELVGGKRRFNELAHALGGVNARTLRKRLAELENEGILRRHVVSHMPPWVEYELTEKGRTLNEVIEAVARWGRRWMAPPRGAGRARPPARGGSGADPPPARGRRAAAGQARRSRGRATAPVSEAHRPR
jgi:DNA-binding HxlR family transcriptional regulator